jgi:glycine/D-amino acid oxidase-like deaminating enzyme
MDQVFAEGFVERPFWWDAAPPQPNPGALPDQADAVVIGGGLTGLSTALELARNGRGALVLDREMIGWGASSRNGGALSGAANLGKAKKSLEKGVPPEVLRGMLQEAEQSLPWFATMLAREGIDCHYTYCGRFTGAHAPSAMAALEKRAAQLNRETPGSAALLSRAEVGQELATDRYAGGLVIQAAGSLHPGKYVQGLAAAATRAGAVLRGGVDVAGFVRDAAGFTIRTSHGTVRAKALMIATNGYTGGATPWHRRRLVPVSSYMIATEPLGAARVRQVMPRLRVYGDTKKVLYYFRPSPDGAHILFGGRASFSEQDAKTAAVTLHRFLTHLLPDLAGVRISHAWRGNVAFAFDFLPHLGVHEGAHYALGCNGSGVVTLSYLGCQAARMILGGGNAPSAFAQLPFPTMPLYSGTPWFIPLVGAWYRMRDRADGWREP